MKYTIDTEKKTIELTSLSSSEIIELAKQYPDFAFVAKIEPDYPYLIPYNSPTKIPLYNDNLVLCGTSSGKYNFGSTATLNHCQGGATLSTFSGNAECLN